METPKEPWNFCETPEEKCTMNYCDDNGCQNRKRLLISEEIPDLTAQLKADKAELLEALEYAKRMLKNSKDAMYDENYISSLIQKMKP